MGIKLQLSGRLKMSDCNAAINAASQARFSMDMGLSRQLAGKTTTYLTSWTTTINTSWTTLAGYYTTSWYTAVSKMTSINTWANVTTSVVTSGSRTTSALTSWSTVTGSWFTVVDAGGNMGHRLTSSSQITSANTSWSTSASWTTSWLTTLPMWSTAWSTSGGSQLTSASAASYRTTSIPTSWTTSFYTIGSIGNKRIAFSDYYGKALYDQFSTTQTKVGPILVGNDYGLAWYITFNVAKRADGVTLDFNTSFSGSWSVNSQQTYNTITLGYNSGARQCETTTYSANYHRGCSNGNQQNKAYTYRLNAIGSGKYEVVLISSSYTQSGC